MLAVAAQPDWRRSSGPSLSAFESWLEARVMSTVRIPPTLRTATGGEKLVSVPGGTVREVIRGLVDGPPGARVAAAHARTATSTGS